MVNVCVWRMMHVDSTMVSCRCDENHLHPIAQSPSHRTCLVALEQRGGDTIDERHVAETHARRLVGRESKDNGREKLLNLWGDNDFKQKMKLETRITESLTDA